MASQPFRLDIADEKLQQLKAKLELSTFPDELQGSGWRYGSPLEDVKKLVSYWKNEFDWRKVEAQINELPQFTTPISIDGFGDLQIHYVHQRSNFDGAIPLLFCHGWVK
jgi:hypothetical protein